MWTKEYLEEYYDEEKENNYYEWSSVEKEDSVGSNNLMDCLRLFTKEEQLGKDDPWYCIECKDFRQAFKKFHIWTAPPILIIHLKRFSYRNSWREKLEQFIQFPLEDLDISEFVIGPNIQTLYDLYAVSNHMGGISHGHYTAYARHRDDGKWYSYDDQNVKEISETSVVTANAYVLFYKRKDTPWGVFDKGLDRLATQKDEETGDEEDSEGDTPSPPIIKLENREGEVNAPMRQESSVEEGLSSVSTIQLQCDISDMNQPFPL
jgi:ubiquitin carboxyl-terminal hydrolase 4/11/15